MEGVRIFRYQVRKEHEIWGPDGFSNLTPPSWTYSDLLVIQPVTSHFVKEVSALLVINGI